MDIELIRQNIREYFWSFDEDGNLICGGYDNGILYGLITFITNEFSADIEKVKSNSISNDILLPIENYSNGTTTYNQIIALKNEVKLYLDISENEVYQEVNRSKLIRNTITLLWKMPSS